MLGGLCWAACGKDPGFTPLSLLELLHRRGRLRPEDLARLDLVEALDSVEPFVATRPPDEIGCLYYSALRRAFIDPREAADAAPHFGRPGGVLPRIADA